MRSNEKKWLACRDLPDLFAYAGDYLGERRAILFAVGCARLADGAMDQPIIAHAVEVLEQFADGKASKSKRTELHREADKAFRAAAKKTPAYFWALAAVAMSHDWVFRAAYHVPFHLECA